MSDLKKQLSGIEALDHLKRAEMLHKASEDGHTIAAIADACGKSAIWVNNYTKLYWFPQKFKFLLTSGQIGLVDLIKSVSTYHSADPEKYDKAYKDLLQKIEEKKKKSPAKRGRKPSDKPKLADLKRYHRVAEWIKSELEGREKRSIVESRALDVVQLILTGSKKDDVIGSLNKITENTAGRK
jgi:hypothetical protein